MIGLLHVWASRRAESAIFRTLRPLMAVRPKAFPRMLLSVAPNRLDLDRL